MIICGMLGEMRTLLRRFADKVYYCPGCGAPCLSQYAANTHC